MTEPTKRADLGRATDAALVASRALVAVAAQSMNELDDVTLPQYRALLILASRGSCTSGELAGHLGVHASTVTRLVDRLAAKALLTRSTPADRREVTLAVSPTGLHLLDGVTAARREGLRAVVHRVPPARRPALIAAFEEFADAAGEIPDDQWSTVLSPPARG
jgi:DNA-binding MarR family transcriptional regulator